MPFEVGNQLAAGKKTGGRKPKSVEWDLQTIFNEACPLDDRISMMRVLASKARAGDVAAIKLFLEYAYHKPRAAPEDNAALSKSERKIVIEYHDDQTPTPAPGAERD